MQTGHFSLKQGIWILLSPVIVIAFLLSISSCTNKDEKADFGTSCVTLSSQEIQDYWVDKGYTTPGATDLIEALEFTTIYDRFTGSLNVYVRGIKSDDNPVSGSDIDLYTSTSCTMPPDIAIGTNFLDISQLDILNKEGKLRNFNYIRFTPQAFPENRSFMNFSVAVVSGTGTEEKGGTLPCPPCEYCRPPCPTDDTLIVR